MSMKTRHSRCADLVCLEASTREKDNCGCAPNRTSHFAAAPVPELFSSKVSEAQKLAQSALVPAGAGTICTALVSQIPSCGRRNVTCPVLSVRAVIFAAGFARFIADRKSVV